MEVIKTFVEIINKEQNVRFRPNDWYGKPINYVLLSWKSLVAPMEIKPLVIDERIKRIVYV